MMMETCKIKIGVMMTMDQKLTQGFWTDIEFDFIIGI